MAYSISKNSDGSIYDAVLLLCCARAITCLYLCLLRMRLYAEILNLHRPDTAAAQIHIPVRRSKCDIAYRDAAGRGCARCGRPAYGPLQIGVAARIGYDVEVAGLGIDVGQYPWRASIAACCADHDTGEAHLTAGHALSIRLQQQIADLQIQSQPKRNTGVHIGTQLHA